MIEFTTINVDGEHVSWKFDNITELRNEWYKEDCDLPSGDDPVVSCKLHGVYIYPHTFECLIEALGIGRSCAQ